MSGAPFVCAGCGGQVEGLEPFWQEDKPYCSQTCAQIEPEPEVVSTPVYAVPLPARVRKLERKPSPEVLEQLEELLAVAKRGELRAIGAMGLRVGGGVLTTWAGDVDVAAMVYAIEVWKAQIIKDSDGGDVDLGGGK